MGFRSGAGAGFDPRKVPTQRVVVDRAHPLANGIVRFWILNAGSPVDLMQGNGATILNSTPVAISTAAGAMHSFNNNPAWQVGSAPIIGALPAWSVVSLAQTTTTGVNVDRAIYSERAPSGNDICLFGMSGWYTAGAGTGIIFRDDGGSLINGPNTNSTATRDWSDGKPHVVVGTKTSSNIKTYTDGILELNTTGVSNTFTNAGIQAVIGGMPADSRSYWIGGIGSVALYARELAQSDAAWLAAEPFAMLRPVVRRTYSVPAAAGSDVTVALTQQAATGAVGTLAPSASKALAQVAGTSAVGTITASTASNVTVALSQVAATGTVGTLSAPVSVSLAQTAGAGTLGTLSAAKSVGITQTSATGTIGTASPGAGVLLSEVAATGTVGTVGVNVGGNVTIALTQTAGIGTVGTIIASLPVTVALSQTAAIGTIGALAPTRVVGVAQAAATGAVGSTAWSAALGLGHVLGTGAVGAISVSGGAVAIGTATPLTVSISPLTKAIYTAAAADAYRTSIQKVPGEGPVLGVVAMAFNGVDQVYAFRANVGATAALLYKDSPAGWVLVPYGNLVSFTAGGTANPLDGDTLTQGGVTATVKRVMWQSGAWAGSAVGQFVITTPSGGNFAAGAATTTSGATVTLSGAQAPITMAAGGRFEFEKANFSGQAITRRIYGCDGVNPAFEFDGDTLAPIKTGLAPDRPSHIVFHKNFLFIAQESSIFYCGAGNPFKWSAVDGGGEIATGDVVTGLITLPGSQSTATLGVFLRTNSAFLYGTDPSTFNFVTFNSGIGAVPYSVQNLFDTFFLDNLGVVTLKTTLNYGNFLPSTLTKNITPFIARERGNLTASAVNREKGQYRLFFGDGYALFATVLNQQYLGSALVLTPAVFNCTDTTSLVTETEATYAGATDGYVHRFDVGTSFDGAVIPAYFTTAWDAVRSPRALKRFRAASIEVQGSSYAEIQYGYQLGYASDQIPQLPSTFAALNLGAIPHWDSFVWDAFVWDGSGLSPTDIDQTGTAENIRVTITSGTNYIGAYTVNSIIHHFSPRRGMRV